MLSFLIMGSIADAQTQTQSLPIQQEPDALQSVQREHDDYSTHVADYLNADDIAIVDRGITNFLILLGRTGDPSKRAREIEAPLLTERSIITNKRLLHIPDVERIMRESMSDSADSMACVTFDTVTSLYHAIGLIAPIPASHHSTWNAPITKLEKIICRCIQKRDSSNFYDETPSAAELARSAFENGEEIHPLMKFVNFAYAAECESTGEFEEALRHYQAVCQTASCDLRSALASVSCMRVMDRIYDNAAKVPDFEIDDQRLQEAVVLLAQKKLEHNYPNTYTQLAAFEGNTHLLRRLGENLNLEVDDTSFAYHRAYLLGIKINNRFSEHFEDVAELNIEKHQAQMQIAKYKLAERRIIDKSNAENAIDYIFEKRNSATTDEERQIWQTAAFEVYKDFIHQYQLSNKTMRISEYVEQRARKLIALTDDDYKPHAGVLHQTIVTNLIKEYNNLVTQELDRALTEQPQSLRTRAAMRDMIDAKKRIGDRETAASLQKYYEKAPLHRIFSRSDLLALELKTQCRKAIRKYCPEESTDPVLSGYLVNALGKLYPGTNISVDLFSGFSIPQDEKRSSNSPGQMIFSEMKIGVDWAIVTNPYPRKGIRDIGRENLILNKSPIFTVLRRDAQNRIHVVGHFSSESAYRNIITQIHRNQDDIQRHLPIETYGTVIDRRRTDRQIQPQSFGNSQAEGMSLVIQEGDNFITGRLTLAKSGQLWFVKA